MATVTKSSLNVSATGITQGVTSNGGTQSTTYTVPANSYAIISINTVSAGTSPLSVYRIDAPSAAIVNNTTVPLNTPVFNIYVGATHSITISAASGGGPTSIILWGVQFTNS